MEVILAQKYGFCFGVKRAIKLAEKNKNSCTLGPLIHNPKEINRLKQDFNVNIEEDLEKISPNKKVIIRTHGIEKERKEYLQNNNFEFIDATCPFVTRPQEITKKMNQEGYDVVIFGDSSHPEVKGIKSYATRSFVASAPKDLEGVKLKNKIALISQTTKKIESFLEIAEYLIKNYKEVRTFNTICNATSQNQEAIDELAQKVDIVIVVGGKNSSNTKQLFSIAKKHCKDSYLVEDEQDLQLQWFVGKKICGISAGASTPDWIIKNVAKTIRQI